MTAAIEHFTDPTCPWAFSAERQRWRLRWLYGDQLVWTDRMVVLSEDASELEGRFPPPVHAKALARIQEMFGMPIDATERERSAASAPACLAVVGARDPLPAARALDHKLGASERRAGADAYWSA